MDADRDRRVAISTSERQTVEAEKESKLKELLAFRDAGVITEAELEEQKAKLRWGIS